MSDESTITWTPPEALQSLGTLPVTIRTMGGAIAAKGVSGQAIEVPEGAYMVSASLPDGQEIMAEKLLKVLAGDSKAAKILLPDTLSQTAMASRANLSEIRYNQGEIIDTAKPARIVKARMWRGHWLEHWSSGRAALVMGMSPSKLTLSESERRILFADDDHDRFIIMWYPREGGRTVRITVVPYDASLNATPDAPEAKLIEASIRENSDPPAIRYSSSVSAETNALLGYLDVGLLGNMQTVSANMITQGDAARLGDGVSLLRGLMGAYVMLRANTLDGMDEWLERLAVVAPDVPDTHCLRAELFAREGHHDRAVEAVRAATRSHCPWFRSGVSYLLERLKLYLDVHDNDNQKFNLSSEDVDIFRTARTRLEVLAPMLATTQLFTTFDIPDDVLPKLLPPKPRG